MGICLLKYFLSTLRINLLWWPLSFSFLSWFSDMNSCLGLWLSLIVIVGFFMTLDWGLIHCSKIAKAALTKLNMLEAPESFIIVGNGVLTCVSFVSYTDSTGETFEGGFSALIDSLLAFILHLIRSINLFSFSVTSLLRPSSSLQRSAPG